MASKKRIELLKTRQTSLKTQIYDNLDLLMGSVNRAPSMLNYSLTSKVKGKTVGKYVRKSLVPTVKKMTDRNKRVRELIRQLSEVNWQLLKLESQ